MLNKTESAALRGIAILGIILHNYTHWLGQMVQENEYTFSEHNVNRFMMELAHPSECWLAHMLSFFGHYGVPVFLFLSAYGLVMKYEGNGTTNGGNAEGKSQSAMSWIWAHWKKLFVMMAIGYATFVLVDYSTPGPRHYEFWNVVGQLGMFSNFYADPDHDIWPGPYWYFGLMVQIYVIYRLLLYPRKGALTGNVKLAILCAICTGIQWFMEPEGMVLQWYRYNALGSMLPFVCGLVYARAVKSNGESKSLLYLLTTKATKSTQFGVLILCIFLIILGGMNFYSWTIVPALVCILHVMFVKLLPERVTTSLAWVGGISAAMFISHPIARKIIIPISRHGSIHTGILLYLLAAIVLGIIFREIIKKAK